MAYIDKIKKGNKIYDIHDPRVDEGQGGGGGDSTITIENTPLVQAFYCIATNEGYGESWFSEGDGIYIFPIGNNISNIFHPDDEIVTLLSEGSYTAGTRVAALNDTIIDVTKLSIYAPILFDSFHSFGMEGGLAAHGCRIHFMECFPQLINCICGVFDGVFYYAIQNNTPVIVISAQAGVNSLIYVPGNEEEVGPEEGPKE